MRYGRFDDERREYVITRPVANWRTIPAATVWVTPSSEMRWQCICQVQADRLVDGSGRQRRFRRPDSGTKICD